MGFLADLFVPLFAAVVGLCILAAVKVTRSKREIIVGGAGVMTFEKFGPLHAREAVEAAMFAAGKMFGAGPGTARLAHIGSDESVAGDGRAWRWEILLVTEQGACIDVVVAPSDEDRGELEQRRIAARVTPVQRAPANMRGLPAQFRDSSEAAADLAGMGVDFVSGDSHLTLSAAWKPDGGPVWKAEAHGKTYVTKFAA